MRYFGSFFALFFLAAEIGHAAVVCQVARELWDRPRTGRAVLAQEAIKPCVTAFLREPAARLLIHHGSAAEPQLQAEELRGWLTALALDPASIELLADTKNGNFLTIEVRFGK